ncbi:hypothetical protein AWB79_05726 [Caballeronia hypogeia]|uniref:Uncharacterized protein n=1 Tax=Caballeronia hypogeia TaxID=1777140 RepID=A0A158CQN3_9BURK|nr:hypothetical protein AWB79_05726 [Caballeronia hypogeia]
MPFVSGTVVARGDYRHNNESANNDWAVIRLVQPVGNDVGFLPLFQIDVKFMKNRPVITAGFPAEKTRDMTDLSVLYGDLSCRLIGMHTYGFQAHACQVTPVSPEDPCLNRDNGQYYAIGMVGGDTDFNGMDRSELDAHANIAVSFDSGKADSVESEGDRIVQALKADQCGNVAREAKVKPTGGRSNDVVFGLFRYPLGDRFEVAGHESACAKDLAEAVPCRFADGDAHGRRRGVRGNGEHRHGALPDR